MGTNFYVENRKCCPTCGKPVDEVHHIGKSSMGWRFTFHGYREHNLNSAKEWLAYLADKQIVDEYGRHWDNTDFVVMIRSQRAGRVAYSERLEIDDDGFPIAHYEFS